MDHMAVMLEAQFDLAALDIITADFIPHNRVAIEVAKAVTLAGTHPEIEAKVHCRNPEEVTRALSIIYSPKVWAREHAKWNSKDACLELPNGSAVSVWLDGKLAVPR